MNRNVITLVTFRLGDDLFALPIERVERVIRFRAPTRVPDVPEWIEGVIEQGSRVVPIVDLRRRISMAPGEAGPDRRIVIAETSFGPVGVVVDAVLEIAGVAPADVEPPPPIFRGFAAEFLTGVVHARPDDRLIIILDADRVLSSADRIVLERSLPEVAGRG